VRNQSAQPEEKKVAHSSIRGIGEKLFSSFSPEGEGQITKTTSNGEI